MWDSRPWLSDREPAKQCSPRRESWLSNTLDGKKLGLQCMANQTNKICVINSLRATITTCLFLGQYLEQQVSHVSCPPRTVSPPENRQLSTELVQPWIAT